MNVEFNFYNINILIIKPIQIDKYSNYNTYSNLKNVM